MLRDYGTLPLGDVLRFAIGYAEDGYPILPQIAGAIRNVEALFRDEWTTSAAVYLPVPEPGTLHRNPQLAATYRRILDESNGDLDAALDCWYRGFVAEAFVALPGGRSGWTAPASATPACSRRTDLRDWSPAYEQPLAVDYHGLTVLKAGPWSQAPVFLQQLRLLEGFDLAAHGARERRVRAHDHRVREARVRRPRGVVRRSRLRRRADGPAALARVRGRAARARR